MSQLFKFDLPYGQVITIEDIAKMTGLPVSAFEGIDFTAFSREQEARVKAEKAAVEKIINPFYAELATEPDINKKKINELVDLGRFIMCYEEPMVIEALSERPDFIVRWENKKIGIEHTQLFDQVTQHKIGKLNGLLHQAADYIIKQSPHVSGLYNPLIIEERIKVNEKLFLDLDKSALRLFAIRLADYIIALFENKQAERPDFIEEIMYRPQNTLSLSLGESFIRRERVMELLNERLQAKQKKISFYKADKHLDECWLLIVYNIATSSSCFKITMEQLPTENILFDKILLFESFDGIIIEGKLVQ